MVQELSLIYVGWFSLIVLFELGVHLVGHRIAERSLGIGDDDGGTAGKLLERILDNYGEAEALKTVLLFYILLPVTTATIIAILPILKLSQTALQKGVALLLGFILLLLSAVLLYWLINEMAHIDESKADFDSSIAS